jgi:hypothetical protein
MNRRVVRLVGVLAVLGGWGGLASAQLITIKTVPVAQGDQFALFPSQRAGMAGVSIALADTLLDPFGNPATGARLSRPYFFGSPGLYTVSSHAGGGRTLPVGVLTRTGPWFGAVWLRLQELDASRQDVGQVFVDQLRPFVRDPTALAGLGAESYGNTYAFGSLGRTLPGSGWSVAGSVFWARLNGVDGVDLLYAGSQGLRQFGHAVDVRVGALKALAGDQSLEAVVLHNRFGMTHDVTYLEFFWDPGTQQQIARPRVEQNLDRTNTWGLHVEYERPTDAHGGRVGLLATANRMSHPKIPNYEVMSIPRDPGYSNAFNLGIGFSRTGGAATFGIDAIYEPIWSHTWADAAGPTPTVNGSVIPAGGMTIENRFRFSNALLRLGVSNTLGRGDGDSTGVSSTWQLGVAVRAIHYTLRQWDHVQAFSRTMQESWVEWAPTWGLSLHFPAFDVRYNGRMTHGVGRPGVRSGFERFDTAPAGGGIIVAPRGPLTLDEVKVLTHQFSLAFPLR